MSPEDRKTPTVRVLNKHTAPLHLPHAVHYDGPGMGGITLAPGLNVVPVGYLSDVSDNPTVEAWMAGGLIEVEPAEMEAEEEHAPSQPESEVKP